MKKLTSIVLGWWFFITGQNKELANKRRVICTRCELRKGRVCGVCFCPIKAKTTVPEETCPHPDGARW